MIRKVHYLCAFTIIFSTLAHSNGLEIGKLCQIKDSKVNACEGISSVEEKKSCYINNLPDMRSACSENSILESINTKHKKRVHDYIIDASKNTINSENIFLAIEKQSILELGHIAERYSEQVDSIKMDIESLVEDALDHIDTGYTFFSLSINAKIQLLSDSQNIDGFLSIRRSLDSEIFSFNKENESLIVINDLISHRGKVLSGNIERHFKAIPEDRKQGELESSVDITFKSDTLEKINNALMKIRSQINRISTSTETNLDTKQSLLISGQSRIDVSQAIADGIFLQKQTEFLTTAESYVDVYQSREVSQFNNLQFLSNKVQAAKNIVRYKRYCENANQSTWHSLGCNRINLFVSSSERFLDGSAYSFLRLSVSRIKQHSQDDDIKRRCDAILNLAASNVGGAADLYDELLKELES